jgi:hypothetical protein
MAAARTSETLVNFDQTTRRYNLEDSHLRTNRRENFKSYKLFIYLNLQVRTNVFILSLLPFIMCEV